MKRKAVKTHYRWRKRRIVYTLGFILMVFLIPAIILSVYVFHRVDYLAVKTPDYPLQNVFSSEDFNLASIGHVIDTEDGETLWCSEIRCNAPQGVVIYLADLKEPSVTYFYGHAGWMKDKGYSSFLLEVRAHGESSGHKQGLGYTEVEDVKALVSYIRGLDKYKNVPIVVQGVGLGGTIAINAAGQISDVAGCIAMNPYAAADTQIDLKMKDYFIPGFLRFVEKPILHQALRILYGKNTADNINPEVQIVEAGKKPILIISCADDPVVPMENTLVLQKAVSDLEESNTEIWVRNSADHYVVFGDDLMGVKNDVEYCNNISGFLGKVVMNYGK